MTQLRVTHVVASVDDVGAGPSYSVTRLACELGLLGAEVIVRSVAGWRGFSPREAAPRAKVPFATIRSALDGDPISRRVCGSRELEDALREDARKADILHTHGLWLMPNVYPSSAARRPSARAAVVLSPRGTLGEAALAFSPRKKQLFWHFLQKRAVANVALLHATSEAEVADIRAFGLRHPVAVIPNGIDLPEPAEASPRKPEILYLGRVHPKKGIDVLIRAWALIAEKRPNWSIRIVGPAEGGHDEDMRRLAAETGAPRVSIEGPAYGPARLAAYREASLFVLPTRHENFALVVAEALAAELPVIASHGAPWPGLESERCGWWIEHGAEPLAKAIERATAESVEVRAEMGKRGRAWMARDFSWAHAATEMIEVYNWVRDGGEPPATVRLDRHRHPTHK